jgi:hypothetical protein
MERQNPFHVAEKKFSEMIDFLQRDESRMLHLSGIEGYLLHDGRDLLRHMLEAHLADRGDGDIGMSVMGADGITRKRNRLRTIRIKTMFGKVNITRRAYSHEHVVSLFPLDALLNLSRLHISYTLQQYLILELLKNSFHESLDSIVRWTGVRITEKQAKDIIDDGALEFTEFYKNICKKERKNARKCPLLILTSDGKGVVMRKSDLRCATRKKARQNSAVNLPTKRTSERKHCKRMATVASVYETERYIRTPVDIVQAFFPAFREDRPRVRRPKPQAKRIWASLRNPPEDVIGEIFSEALRRDPDRKKEWVVCVDGDLPQIAHFKNLSLKFDAPITIVCDIVHVLEYLWKAGKVLQSEEKIEEWVVKKLSQILAGNSKQVAAGMRRSATLLRLTKPVRKPVDNCVRYLTNHAPCLCYDDYLQTGYPVATGIIEGTCRYLVKDRMEITGARWSLEGAEAL